MSRRWRNSQYRISLARKKKETREQSFFNRLTWRRMPYNFVFLLQREWNALEEAVPVVAKGIAKLNITRKQFCSSPFKRSQSALVMAHALTGCQIVWPLKKYLDIPFLHLRKRVGKWVCHENKGELLFSGGFLLNELEEHIPYYHRNASGSARDSYAETTKIFREIIVPKFP